MLWLNYIAILFLAMGILSKYVSPVNFWPIAFFSLAFPFIIIFNVLLVIFWAAQFRIQALFSFIAIGLSLPTVIGYIQLSFIKPKVNNKDIKVMSYNSMLFDLYNWKKNGQSRDTILSYLAEENPDILCLQEFYTSEEKGDFNNIDTLTSLLTAKNKHIEYTTTLRKFDHWGIATFTKYPIIKQGKIDFNTRANNTCIYTDVIIKTDTVRIYNMHLQSISFSKDDYRFIEELNNDTTDTKNEIERSKNILRRLKRAFEKRAIQAEIIAEHIKQCRYKIIVCGDFNDTPASYTYQTIKGKLKDSFIEKGNGFESTYAGKFPRFRIDYIFHSEDLKCKDYTRASETLTDHYPIMAYFEIIH
jgi:endonuclease/exonuclease/phosphatase family metal-dependent hydrolase